MSLKLGYRSLHPLHHTFFSLISQYYSFFFLAVSHFRSGCKQKETVAQRFSFVTPAAQRKKQKQEDQTRVDEETVAETQPTWDIYYSVRTGGEI